MTTHATFPMATASRYSVPMEHFCAGGADRSLAAHSARSTDWFSTVTSLAFGPDGDLFVADFYNHRVQKFQPDGTFLTDFGSQGVGDGQIDHALGVAVAGDGPLFMANSATSACTGGGQPRAEHDFHSDIHPLCRQLFCRADHLPRPRGTSA